MAHKTWFITGVSRGLGLEIAAAAIARGDVVVGTTRDGRVPEAISSERLHIIPLELSDMAAIEQAVSKAAGVAGRLDVIVNNAGFGLLGSIETASQREIEQIFMVNVYAPLAVIRGALPHLRRRTRGHIMNISSVAAIAPAPGSGIYSATKAAISALSVSLAQEVAPMGVWVTTVSPGSFRTEFLSERSVCRTQRNIDDYAATSGRAVTGLLHKNGKQIGDPEKAAAAILAAVDADEPPLDLVLGSDALQRTRARLDRFEDDLRQWEDISTSTDFAI
ncbi:SDR family NAD(P)-dependent oxidoreductase [Sphingobium sp. LMA1-1-1.1]|uniref:SDR family NAD(P)-dependent oxidoreductase n=1 Tax=unclassified Sphingobium TaxID=2611147 RepID=UPI0034323617